MNFAYLKKFQKSPEMIVIISLLLIFMCEIIACEKKIAPSKQTAYSLIIEKFNIEENWGETSPLDVSMEGRPFAISITPAGGSFYGWVKLGSHPGKIEKITCNPPSCDMQCSIENAIGDNIAIDNTKVDICVYLKLAYGITHIFAIDLGYEPAPPAMAECNDNMDNDNDGRIDYQVDYGCAFYNDNNETEGSQIVGISPEIYFRNPRVENVQGYASSSPYTKQAVTIEYKPSDPFTGRLVVTKISSEGFYFTDIDPIQPDRGYNSLYAYNFNTPWKLRECDILTKVDGIVGEFLGFTELNYPGWLVLPVCSDTFDNDGDGLIDTQDPDCVSPDDMSESPIPEEFQKSGSRIRVPVPSSSSECPIPEPVELTPSIISNASRMESLESSLVKVENASVSTTFRNCDFDGDRNVSYTGEEGDCLNQCNSDPDCTELTQFWKYGQWILNAGGTKIFVISRDSYPEFSPMSHKGETLLLVRGILKQIEFITPPWIIEIRCRADLVQTGEEIIPVYQACVPPVARGEHYEP